MLQTAKDLLDRYSLSVSRGPTTTDKVGPLNRVVVGPDEALDYILGVVERGWLW